MPPTHACPFPVQPMCKEMNQLSLLTRRQSERVREDQLHADNFSTFKNRSFISLLSFSFLIPQSLLFPFSLLFFTFLFHILFSLIFTLSIFNILFPSFLVPSLLVFCLSFLISSSCSFNLYWKILGLHWSVFVISQREYRWTEFSRRVLVYHSTKS